MIQQRREHYLRKDLANETNRQASENQTSEDQVSEDQVSEDQVSEDQVSEDQSSEDQAFERAIVDIAVCIVRTTLRLGENLRRGRLGGERGVNKSIGEELWKVLVGAIEVGRVLRPELLEEEGEYVRSTPLVD